MSVGGRWFPAIALFTVTAAGACSPSARPISEKPVQTTPAAETGPPVRAVITIEQPSALFAAIERHDVAAIQAQLDGGASPDLRESKDDGASWPAIAMGMRQVGAPVVSQADFDDSLAIVDLLLQRGANPNIRWCEAGQSGCSEPTGVTPLMYAAALGVAEFSSTLSRRGADASLHDWRGLTAADYAGILTGAGSLCARASRDDDLVAMGRALARREDVYDARIRAATGPITSPPDAVAPTTDERICTAAAHAAARHRLPTDLEPRPRLIRPVLAIPVGRLWLVGEPGSGEHGVFDARWLLLGWVSGADWQQPVDYVNLRNRYADLRNGYAHLRNGPPWTTPSFTAKSPRATRSSIGKPSSTGW